jgi:beta-glucanase (GH16 family)
LDIAKESYFSKRVILAKNKSVEVWPFDQPFYMILNVAVGGNFGGTEVDESIFPQEFVIDYVRVYQ